MMEGAGFDHEREESEPGAMLPFGTTPMQQQKREG